jgi:hypothetical protein
MLKRSTLKYNNSLTKGDDGFYRGLRSSSIPIPFIPDRGYEFLEAIYFPQFDIIDFNESLFEDPLSFYRSEIIAGLVIRPQNNQTVARTASTNRIFPMIMLVAIT